jgi:outer membrane protein OmpA-like peptidoglycan-associated protein
MKATPDSTGSEAYNLELSLRRAESVSNYFMDN